MWLNFYYDCSMKKNLTFILIFASIAAHCQVQSIHLQLVLDSSEYTFRFPKSDESQVQPKQGYKKYLDSFMELVGKDARYESIATDAVITFTVFSDGSVDYFNTKQDPTGNDIVYIEKLQELGSWAPSDVNDRRVSLHIVSKDQLVYTIVDEPARFKGGLNALYEFLAEELNYPDTAISMDIEGRVFVQFIIEKDGRLTEIQTVKGIGAGCDEEAERALAESSPWEPGTIGGQPVRQKMILNILFKIPKKSKVKEE